MMTTHWKIDPSHSEVEFKVKHLMITTITGHFSAYQLDVTSAGDNFTKVSSIAFSAELDSISTNNEQRDEHLKSAEFFDMASYSQITFSGDSLTQQEDGYLLTGDLTIKGITKKITLKADFEGIITDPYGQVKAGFTITGKISRKEFGLMFNAMTDTGQIVVGDEIKITCNIQLVRQ